MRFLKKDVYNENDYFAHQAKNQTLQKLEKITDKVCTRFADIYNKYIQDLKSILNKDDFIYASEIVPSLSGCSLDNFQVHFDPNHPKEYSIDMVFSFRKQRIIINYFDVDFINMGFTKKDPSFLPHIKDAFLGFSQVGHAEFIYCLDSKFRHNIFFLSGSELEFSFRSVSWHADE